MQLSIQMINLGVGLFQLAQSAKCNKLLCEKLALLLQSLGWNANQLREVYIQLSLPLDQLEGFMVTIVEIMRSAEALVERASSVGRLHRYLMARSMRERFNEEFASINGALTSLAAFTSVHNLGRLGAEDKLRTEIDTLKNRISELQKQAASPQIPEDEEVYNELNKILRQMFDKEVDMTYGRSQLLAEMERLYDDDDHEADPGNVLRILEGNVRRHERKETEEKSQYAHFVSKELLVATQILTMNPPSWSQCPITLSVMKDPVMIVGSPSLTVCDRGAIENWFRKGGTTCPVSRAQLRDFTLAPIHNLKNAICSWIEESAWNEKLKEDFACHQENDSPIFKSAASAVVTGFQVSDDGGESEYVSIPDSKEFGFSDFPQVEIETVPALSTVGRHPPRMLLDLSEGKTKKRPSRTHSMLTPAEPEGSNASVFDLQSEVPPASKCAKIARPKKPYCCRRKGYKGSRLRDAARTGNVCEVEALLSSGADVDAKAPFYLPHMHERTPLICAAANGKLKVVKALISAGADLEAKEPDGRTALIRAAYGNHLVVVKALVAAGAKLETRSDNEWTALDWAISWPRAEIVQFLRSMQNK